MATVFRIASNDDILTGMFSERSRQYKDIITNHDPIKNPLPGKDKLMGNVWLSLENNLKYYFGFKTIQQLLNWIDIDKIKTEVCDKLSLYVIEIDEDNIIMGETQVAMFIDAMYDFEQYQLKKLVDFI